MFIDFGYSEGVSDGVGALMSFVYAWYLLESRNGRVDGVHT